MIPYKNNGDPAMRYEGLARSVFDNWGKWDDPWGYAAQDKYNKFCPSPGLEGKRALSTIFIKMIIDKPSSKELEAIKLLENRVWEAKSQQDIITIIDEGIDMAERFGYGEV